MTLMALAVVLPAAPRVRQGRDMAKLSWLAGCHELRAGARVVHEQWMAPLGGMMMGMSRTVARDTVREYEQLRIETRGDKVAYVAHPSRQAETSFVAETLNDTMVVFSNPEHDFPQRIIYRRLSADSTMARIEGTRGGQLRGINFPMKRIACG